MREPRSRRLGAVAGLLVLVATATRASAQAEPEGPAATIAVEAGPCFGDGSLPPDGWTEILVRITNRGPTAVAGRVRITTLGPSWARREATNRSESAFSAAPGATVHVQLPSRVLGRAATELRVQTAGGEVLHDRALALPVGSRLLLGVVGPSPLAPALRDVPVPARVDPFMVVVHGYAPSGTALTAEVASAARDASTGDALLPRTVAGYTRLSAVLLTSEDLARLDAQEVEALSGWLLVGGTLALVVTRPEDVRHPTLVALVGGEATSGAAHPETVAPLLPPLPVSGSPFGRPPASVAPPPDAALARELVGWRGGNLRPSPYGASAGYGLGEVHLLAFDPSRAPAVEAPWAHVRLIDLVRRATERIATVLFRPGQIDGDLSEVRRQLDPNEASRWAIGLAALLLCLYAIAAGPVSFAVFRRKNRPLAALAALPVLSLGSFLLVVVIGVGNKGCSGRARHLTVIEAGAGMSVGAARRWRAFFAPGARTLTVAASGATAVLDQVVPEEEPELAVLQRDGLRLADVQLRPWATAVVRDDGRARVGGGVALVPDGGDAVRIVNRSGRRLRGLLLWRPNGEVGFRASLDDGASLESGSMEPVYGAATTLTGSASPPGMTFVPYARVTPLFERTAEGLGNAWEAVWRSLATERVWFPADVPVLLAELEGGEGRSSDTGMPLDRDRVLVRVVGWGGAP
jgi:hypothetical protein